MILALDCESTGLDFRHGCRPFAVTATTDDGVDHWWEWPVDPLTREVAWGPGDLGEIMRLVDRAEAVVFHNSKFDITALGSLDPAVKQDWPWHKTHDTAVAAHLLKSNGLKSLDVLTVRYLNTDITRLEKDLEEAVKAARRLCKKWFPDWRLTSEDDPTMPSVKGESWRGDYWLPKAVYERRGQVETAGKVPDSWNDVLLRYAKPDPAATLACHLEMQKHIDRRNLGKIYEFRRNLLPSFFQMEERGVTYSRERGRKLVSEYTAESSRLAGVCKGIAAGYGVGLELPANGVNLQLRSLLLDEDKMALPPVYNRKAKTDAPTLNKEAFAKYLAELPQDDPRWVFVKSLSSKRSRDTACAYLAGYERFALPLPFPPKNSHDGSVAGGGGRGVRGGTAGGRAVAGQAVGAWVRLHPSINMVGTDTLRCSSKSPNEQNISKKEDFNLRFGFGPAPGREWWSMDAKNIELRLPFYECGEQSLIELFERPDEPPFYGSNHLMNFSVIYPDLWAEAVKEVGPDKAGPHCKKKYADSWYQWCKNGNFAIQYGAVLPDDDTRWGTADRAFHKLGAHAMLKARFSKLEGLNRKCIAHANRHGYVETIPDRTIDPDRGYPLECTRTGRGSILETVPLSYRIQGSAMHWTTKAMWRCDAVLGQWRREGFDAFITLQIHDELVFDMPRRADPRRSPQRSNLGRVRVLQREAEKGGVLDYNIPTPVGVELHSESYSVGVSF